MIKVIQDQNVHVAHPVRYELNKIDAFERQFSPSQGLATNRNKKKKRTEGEKGGKEKWENVERRDKRINREGVENNCAGVPTEINRATTREINDPARINNASTALLHKRFHEHHQR